MILSSNTSVSELKGVGPKKLKLLNKIGIETLIDIIYHFPRGYEDRRNKLKISDLKLNESALVEAKVLQIMLPAQRYGKKPPMKLIVGDGTGTMEVVFFKYDYLRNIFKTGNSYVFFGEVKYGREMCQMIHPDFNESGKDEEHDILPVYSLTEGLTQREMRTWTKAALNLVPRLKEYLPEPTIQRNNLCSMQQALLNIHYPQNERTVSQAKYRLIFEELLLLQLGLSYIKRKNTAQLKGISFDKNTDLDSFIKKLPYRLTQAQLRVIDEIQKDMVSQRRMNRLVQGDVGSGKTIVAATAMLRAVENGYTAVMMAPTEILAKQHYESLNEIFKPLNIDVYLLTGSTGQTDRNAILDKIQNDDPKILIGTHAVIQADVEYGKLGLVITDEQHRFGVQQRVELSKKGQAPDILVMTATPIPRTLAYILYGDLDISIIDELPPGRQEIKTYAVRGRERKRIYDFIRKNVDEGGQAYIVTPLIEDSEKLSNVKSAQTVYESVNKEFPQYRVMLLHGAMKQAEKDVIMQDYNDGKIDILVSTVVIEVGIDVKNANLMVIENAERFGLAQLHQLRGRVGRGDRQSYCIFISDATNEEATSRIKTMVEVTDGFVIAEKDLEMRGPGELLGSRQHGIPTLRISDLVKHVKVLDAVKKESDLILDADPTLCDDGNRLLKDKIKLMFSDSSEIGL